MTPLPIAALTVLAGEDKRGVVVYVYVCPSWNPLSTEAHLQALEERGYYK